MRPPTMASQGREFHSVQPTAWFECDFLCKLVMFLSLKFS